MSRISNLNPVKVVKAFEKAGWRIMGQKGSHIKLKKSGNMHILSIPIHKGKPVKQGLLRDQIGNANMTVKEFLDLYE